MDNKLKILLEEQGFLKKEQEKLKEESKTLDIIIENYCKRHDICRSCNGEGEIYIPTDGGGDPHHRSSDDKHSCSVCGGTGKYFKKGGN